LVLDECCDLDDRHRREVAAHHAAIDLADLSRLREIGALVGDEPCQPHHLFGARARLGEYGDYVVESLLELPWKIVALEFAVLVPADLAGDEDETPLRLDAIGIAFGPCPIRRLQHAHGQFPSNTGVRFPANAS